MIRGSWNHKAPEITFRCPRDNTSREVTAQVRAWSGNPPLNKGTPIHPEIAMAIAAGWQSPGQDGMPFAAFASTGTITESLVPAIEWKIWLLDSKDASLGIYTTPDGKGGWVTGDLGTPEENAMALRALLAYIRACR